MIFDQQKIPRTLPINIFNIDVILICSKVWKWHQSSVMVKIELMRIDSEAVITRDPKQSLFKSMSSKSLVTYNTSVASQTHLQTNSVVTSSFLNLRSPFRRIRVVGGASVGSPERNKKKTPEEELVSRVSLPCVHGCCYCVYGKQLLGPVRVYISNYTPEKLPENKKIRGIKDGNGKKVLPVSRRQDIKGLVYDQKTHSLHPPVVPLRPRPRQPARFKHRNIQSGVGSGYQRVSTTNHHTKWSKSKHWCFYPLLK